MPDVRLARPLLEVASMNSNTNEPMIDGRQASIALRLPYYWFRDPTERSRYRIPHYVLGGLIRYRLSELSQWAAKSSAVKEWRPDDAQGVGK
jgi:Uma2 family endonuclease